MNLAGKKIVLAVTGSIAAYKAPQLVRLLVKTGADVKVITTPDAEKFVSPLALATVSKHPVYSNISNGDAWNNHVALGRWADALLVAPCSANTLAKMANGLCDNLVCAVYLSAICPVFVAPAMDEDMWHHKATGDNIKRILTFSNHLIPVAHGELASGLIGEGRMAEPEDIVAFLDNYFIKENNSSLKGQKVLVTAGPTYERLDPVRFIGNFSSGKMGIALAEELAAKGAEVSLILGPTHLSAQHTNITTTRVESAEEMYNACISVFPAVSVAILSAAVADFRPEQKETEKIKKGANALHISLVKNPDILATLGEMKKPGQIVVGFALETSNELENARKKMHEKKADSIVLNSLRDEGAGFGKDTNKVTLLSANGSVNILPLQSKQEIAKGIVNHILELQHAQ